MNRTPSSTERMNQMPEMAKIADEVSGLVKSIELFAAKVVIR